MVVKTLGELAELLSCDMVGDASQAIEQVVHPKFASGPQDLALLLDKSLLESLEQHSLQTVLLPADLDLPQIPNRLLVKRPKVALAILLDIYEKPTYVAPGIHPSAVIDPTALIEDDVSIGPLCVVGPRTHIGTGTKLVANVTIGADVVIGSDCFFHPGVVIGDRVHIGHRNILHPNASIGNDGFSFVTPEAGSVEAARARGKVDAQNTHLLRINSIGTVILEDDVEIGANSCVDRATLGETRIKRGSKLDNQVQIAHNVVLGENCLLAAQVGIAGSTTIGNRVVMAGQAGVKDHATIGDDVIVMGKSGIASDVVEPKTIIAGVHGMPHREYLRYEMGLKRAAALPPKVKELTSRLEALEKKLHELEAHQPV